MIVTNEIHFCSFQQHVDTLFKITHTGTFNISIRALMLIYQVSSAKQVRSPRSAGRLQ